MELGLETPRVGSYVAFLSITEGSQPRGAREHFAAVSRFLEDVMRLQGGLRPYVGVREVQESRQEWSGVAVWHSHVVMLDWRRIDLADLRALAARHGLGRVNVRAKRIEDPTRDGYGVARYMAKTLGAYMTKSSGSDGSWANAMAHLPRGSRLVFSSTSWAEGVTLAQVERRRLAERRTEVLRRQLGQLVDLCPTPVGGSSWEQEAAALRALLAAGLLVVAEPDAPVPEQLTLG